MEHQFANVGDLSSRNGYARADRPTLGTEIGDSQRRRAHYPKIPYRGIYTEGARVARLDWAREQTGASLDPLQTTRLQAERLTKNVENLIGTVEVPVGLAGPVLFHGQQAHGHIYAPIATSEGALVLSATRGALAVTRSGGVTTRVVSQRMVRAPLFWLSSLDEAFRFADWIRMNVHGLRAQVEMISRHANLIEVEPLIMGRMVHVSFVYETGDAAGQNMTTATTWRACQWIADQVADSAQFTIERFVIEGNVSTDKKASFRSLINGRGTRVIAEAILDRATLRTILRVTPEEMAEVNVAALGGAISSGMMGYNVNFANMIAGLFTATGQDIACVHESSVGHLQLQPVADGLYASVVLPSLVIGTVGGGTHLPAQRALLEMMECTGEGSSARLAEIIAGYCLALDVSTASAIVSGVFAAAHERYGRNRPVMWLSADDLTPAFFEPGLQTALGDPSIQVDSANQTRATAGSSILTELTSREVDKLIGLLPYRLDYRDGSGQQQTLDVVAKVKPVDQEVIVMADSLAAMCGPHLAEIYRRFRDRVGFAGCHIRELGIYEQTDPRFVKHAPRVYGTYRDDAREAYIVVLEKLEGLLLMDSATGAEGWERCHIEAALRGVGEVHAIWLGREEELQAQPWLGPIQTAAGMQEMAELWDALAVHNAEEFPGLIRPEQLALLRELIRTLGNWWPRIESLPRTLVHNDFNPRNVALREVDGELRLCAYDWELATLHLPQHDLAEFLCFVLHPDVDKADVDHYLEVHRQALLRASGIQLDPDTWREGYLFSLYDLAVNRFALYLVAYTLRHYPFVERTMKTLWRLLAIELGDLPQPQPSGRLGAAS